MAFAARLSAPYLQALDYEYGVGDVHNVAMRHFVATHCAACGAAATNHCARCKLVSYCGQARDLASHLLLTTLTTYDLRPAALLLTAHHLLWYYHGEYMASYCLAIVGRRASGRRGKRTSSSACQARLPCQAT